MQRTSEKSGIKEEAKASMTAASVLLGFIRFLEMEGVLYPFTERDLIIAKYLFQNALKSEPNYFMWGLAKFITCSPYFVQREFFHRNVSPGYDTAIFARKFMIKDYIKRTPDLKQLVILGGGYDRLFLEALENENLTCFELDRGKTRATKIKGLLSIPSNILGPLSYAHDGLVSINKKVYFIECDFIQDDLTTVLSANGFKKGEKTLVVGEGLTMYLEASDIDKLMASLQELLGENDEVLLSFLSNLNVSNFLNTALKTSNEVVLFSLPAENVISYVGQFEFDVIFKSYLEDRIGFSRDLSLVAAYKNHPERLQEHYYFLKKTTNVLEKNQDKKISEVPDYAPDLSAYAPRGPIKSISRRER